MPDQVLAVVAARNSPDIGPTVRSLLPTGRVDRCIVVHDGSSDDTAARARGAGATVLVLAANAGKGAAVRHGIEAAPGAGVDLRVDTDLGETDHPCLQGAWPAGASRPVVQPLGTGGK